VESQGNSPHRKPGQRAAARHQCPRAVAEQEAVAGQRGVGDDLQARRARPGRENLQFVLVIQVQAEAMAQDDEVQAGRGDVGDDADIDRSRNQNRSRRSASRSGLYGPP